MLLKLFFLLQLFDLLLDVITELVICLCFRLFGLFLAARSYSIELLSEMGLELNEETFYFVDEDRTG